MCYWPISFWGALALLGLFVPRVAGQSYSFATVAGAAGVKGSADGNGTVARFNASGLAIDRSDNLIIADSENNTIRRMTPAGLVTTIAGTAGAFRITDGIGPAAHFGQPRRVAVDAAGIIYVADTFCVRKITPDGAVTTLAGNPAVRAFADGVGAAASFNSVDGIAVDPQGNVFVTDGFSYVLRKITPAGAVSTVAGVLGVHASSNLEDGYFDWPSGVACDRAGNVYVADFPQRVVKWTGSGTTTLAGSVIGTSDGLGKAASFYGITGIAADASGTLFTTETDNSVVRRITPAGEVTTIGGQAGHPGTFDGVGVSARFTQPRDIAVDSAGNLYVLDYYGTIIRKGTPRTGPVPPTITQHPAPPDKLNRNIGAGSSLTLSAAASGAAPLSVQWTKNGAPIPGATTSTFSLSAVTPVDSGVYAFTASNSGGTASSDPITLRVYAPDVTTLIPRHAKPGGSFLWGIAAGSGQLVAVGTDGAVLTSTEGIDWVRRNVGTNEWLVGVTYGDGKFVAVGDRGIILVSNDGVAWTRAASGTTQRLNNVAFGIGQFVAVGEGGTLLTSRDAQTWTARATNVTGWLRGIVYAPFVPMPGRTYLGDNGSGRFYASGQNGVLLSSFDGEHWGVATTGYYSVYRNTRDIEALAEGPIGIGEDGTIITTASFYLSSKAPFGVGPNGESLVEVDVFTVWGANNIGLSGRFRGLSRGAGAWFATGENGVVAAAADASGPWAIVPSGTNANLVASVFYNDRLFIVGEDETILQTDSLYRSRLINIATRGRAGREANSLISGFVISGSRSKTILLRAAGPSLAAFGVGDALPGTALTLFNSAGQVFAQNTNGWSSDGFTAPRIAAAAAQVGAFPFAAGSADAALLMTLSPGAYTAQVASRDNTTGVALIEAYDADAPSNITSRAINISTRGPVSGTAGPLIAGFVINGASSRRVLVRAVGPSLASLGVAGALADPQIQIYDSTGSLHYIAAEWSTRADVSDIRAAADLAGAFPLQEESSDAALVVTLLPGAWTVTVTGRNNSSGVALVEVYDLP